MNEERHISKRSIIMMGFIIFIVIPTIIIGLYRCPALSDHDNMKCDVCGKTAIHYWMRGGTCYELCGKHYSRWVSKDLADAKYYQKSTI